MGRAFEKMHAGLQGALAFARDEYTASANRGREAAPHHVPSPVHERSFDMASVSKFPAAGTVHWFNECVDRSRSGVITEVVTVTPGLASVILQRNADNRSIKPVKSQHYAADIIAGRWVFNGEPIIVSDTGELNDGQHRMQAVIDANIPVQFLIVFGLPRETRATVDQGAARTAGDYLAMGGMTNANMTAGITRLVRAYYDSGEKGLSLAKEYSNAQIVAAAKADPALHEAGDYAQCVTKYARGMLLPSIIGFCFYVLNEVDPTDAHEYLNQICVGENIKRGDPAFAVRSALSNVERSSKAQRAELVFRGWNAFRQGRKLTLAKTLGTFPALV